MNCHSLQSCVVWRWECGSFVLALSFGPFVMEFLILLVSLGWLQELWRLCLVWILRGWEEVEKERFLGIVHFFFYHLGVMEGEEVENFEDKREEIECLWDRLHFLASFWALVTKEFENIPLCYITARWTTPSGL